MDRAAKYTEERGNAALAGGPRPRALLGSVKPPRGGRLPPLSETAGEVDEEQLALAREQFDRFDKDGSGTIDKAELRDVFEALHVHMAPSVLESYVRAAFTTHDVDLSGALEFDEFVGVYGAILRENRMRGFSFAEWKKSRGQGK